MLNKSTLTAILLATTMAIGAGLAMPVSAKTHHPKAKSEKAMAAAFCSLSVGKPASTAKVLGKPHGHVLLYSGWKGAYPDATGVKGKEWDLKRGWIGKHPGLEVISQNGIIVQLEAYGNLDAATMVGSEVVKASFPCARTRGAGPVQITPVITFTVTGSAPDGITITYGTESIEDSGGSTLPWSATLPIDNTVLYYDITAQLSGSGTISCSIHVGTKGLLQTGSASGGYNICSAEVSPDPVTGGWEAN